ncbi:MAG TPA: hypothetical protein PKC28_03095, partial [Bdellovibrionales bacterium]|nr:hypothetical protein [Bdellovibrionales bacterium]
MFHFKTLFCLIAMSSASAYAQVQSQHQTSTATPYNRFSTTQQQPRTQKPSDSSKMSILESLFRGIFGGGGGSNSWTGNSQHSTSSSAAGGTRPVQINSSWDYKNDGSGRAPIASGKCGSVLVDCRRHRITMSGQTYDDKYAVIDCGAGNKTVNGTGTIGGLHSGAVVKDGVGINNFPGMGASGGGKVFHTVFLRNPPNPTGVDKSKGCIRVHPKVLALLKNC